MNTWYRMESLRRYMKNKGITAVLVSDPAHQFYLSGFKALIYSRPILLIMDSEQTGLIVPGLEEVHARREAYVDQILVYYEHPNGNEVVTSPFALIADFLKRYPEGSTIGVDFSTTPANLTALIRDKGFDLQDIGEKLFRMRYVKDAEEIRLMEQAGELVNVAVSETLKACRPGVTEIEIDAKGNAALFEETSRRFPDATLDFLVMSPSGVERSVMPHVFSNTRVLQHGDVLIHSRQVSLNGYRAELERTVILGEPTAEQRKAFQAAIDAQQAALEAIKPGITAAEVDRVAREWIEKAGYGEFFIHRTGHGIGISPHEKPYLRFDNDLVLQEGMAFTIEPGIYIPGVGGFRHSDTVILIADGSRLITDYPRDMERLILKEN